MRISKEVPTGIIDGNNKVFQTLNPIGQIDDIWIDGAIYVGYTFVGNTITFSDAPTASVYLDYDTLDTITPISSETTLGKVKERVWQQLGQRSTNNTGIVTTTSTNFSNSIVEREINIVANEVWRGKIINPITNKVHRAGKLFFQESMHSFRSGYVSIVTSQANIGDITIETETANLLPAGYVLIAGDIVKYTSKTLNSLNGVTGIKKSYLVGDKVEQVYELPINYDIMTSIEILRGTVFKELTCQYSILRDEGKPLIKLNNINSGEVIRISFINKYIAPSSDTESFPLPDMYGESVIADIVAGRLAYPKGLPQSERLLQMGFQALSGMYMFYSKDKKELNQKILPQTRLGRYSL